MNVASEAMSDIPESPMLSVIVVSYNTREMTLACLRSLYAQTLDTTFELLVVDNCSTDGSADAIEREFPQATVLRPDRNTGFAGGNNLAAHKARGAYLLLLNPDTVVLDRGIDNLMAFARREPARGIWGGKTYFADKSVNNTFCWKRQTLWSTICCAAGLSSLARGSAWADPEALGARVGEGVFDVDIVSGCFLLITRDLWNRLGGFDPAFFMYGEEADLCLRARRLGAQPGIDTTASIVHYGGASEKVRADKLVRLIKAKVQLIRRHWSPLLAPVGVAMLTLWPLTRTVAWRIIGIVKRTGEGASTWAEVWRRRGEWTREKRPAVTAPAQTAEAARG